MFFVGAVYFWAQLKQVKTKLTPTLTDAMIKGADGIVAFSIANRDVDIVFFPSTRKDNQFYYVTVQGEKEHEKFHWKISQDDVCLIRGRTLSTFILRDKVRAINPELIQSIPNLSQEDKKNLINDVINYVALKNQYSNLSAELLKARDPALKAEIERRRAMLLEQMDELEKKWSFVVQRIKADDVLLIHHPDDPEYYYLIRAVNLEKLADAMTGVRPAEIYETAYSMFVRWVKAFVADLSKMFNVPVKLGQQVGGFSWWWILLALGGLGLLVLMLVGR